VAVDEQEAPETLAVQRVEQVAQDARKVSSRNVGLPG
jgi:hypothetical protein